MMLKELMDKGMTEEEAELEITRQEMEITNRQAQAKWNEEKKAA